jgi:hypothetical protein
MKSAQRAEYTDSDFRLVDAGWDKELDAALQLKHSGIWMVCPFIKKSVAGRIRNGAKTNSIQIITRFNPADFAARVSDIAALRLLLKCGAKIRGVRNLHAKLYGFGDRLVIVTSANLTEAALSTNHEFGFVSGDARIVGKSRNYFDRLWALAGADLKTQQLDDWERRVEAYWARGGNPTNASGLVDEGVNLNILPGLPAFQECVVDRPEQSFIKFFGESNDRASRSMSIFDEVASSGSHWACTYPKDKRPRQARDGAVMFMGRLVKEPVDIMIYGRAVAMRHRPGRDDATAEDIRMRAWKAKWPRYVRVHDAVFVGGNLSNGVSQNELMSALKANSFDSTQRHARLRIGNQDPRKAYSQQAAVLLSSQGFDWLNERFEQALGRYGRMPQADLERLDWPTLP